MSSAEDLIEAWTRDSSATEQHAAEVDEHLAAAARALRQHQLGQPRGQVSPAGSPCIRPIESYVRASVVVPGGSIEAGLQRCEGEPLRLKRAELRRILTEEALAINGEDLDEENAVGLTARLRLRLAGAWPGLGWFVELWMARAGDDDEPLTQVYAPWGMPMAERP